MTNYSNPRMRAVIDNWPHGSQRVQAVFSIEAASRGERAIRQTSGAPKKLTYALKARIVDGGGGRTYIAEENGSHVTIMRGDMRFQEETIFPDNPRYAAAMALFA